jgi:hypothetical protein
LRVGFVSGTRSWLRTRALGAKQRKMRLERVLYPDVYSIPYFFADGFRFIREGAPVRPADYDLVLTELNRAPGQMEYIDAVIRTGVPVAVIPGPPELLASVLTRESLPLVQRILRRARHVWAYSESVAAYCDGLIDEERAVVIPWPFHHRQVVELGEGGEEQRGGDALRVLLNVPTRFVGLGQNEPFVVKAVLQELMRADPAGPRLDLRTFVYTRQDRERFREAGYAADFPIRLERKMGYRAFVRLVAGCDAVVNLTGGNVLGRITYLAAALGKPGVFSENAELNHALYGQALAAPGDAERLRELLGELLSGLRRGSAAPRFLPDSAVAARVGDFHENSRRFREILATPVR